MLFFTFSPHILKSSLKVSDVMAVPAGEWHKQSVLEQEWQTAGQL